MAFLELTHVEAFYGKIRALKGIDLNVEQGEIVTLIGANGAGKSTTLKAISGLMKLGPEAKITFDGEDITHLPPHEIAARGIAHVPEGRGIFAENTVLENLRMGAYLSRNKARTQELLETSLDLFPRLRERLRQQAGTLSGGEQQMLTMARGLMMEPKLMLLDEPSMGLAPVIVEQIFSLPGLGQMTLTGINQRDYPVVQGCVLFIAFVYVIVNLVVDVLYAYIDPRISYD